MNMQRLSCRLVLTRLLPLFLWAFAAMDAMAQSDPPARVASLSQLEGSVAFAPAGETEWSEAQRNRPITLGDRLWTDAGARAEVHLGSAVLHLNGRSYLEVATLVDGAFQASLNEGTLNARVRQLQAGENFEIDTPQLAFRASQPGDFRIDVDPASGTTRVVVHEGTATVFGAQGQALTMQAGQELAFAGRDLERVAMPPSRDDGFDRWASDRNRLEDQSVAARYVPRDVVGYQQLDPYGNWAQDPNYGAVWFPNIAVADWAPYRYGHWDWIAPWGWTWIDDAPWGFAPFHYGRWAMIGTRWCWVPGRIGPRPVYSPALVAFVGAGPSIGWFPLAPGEAWRPSYHASPSYVRNVNRNIVVRDASNPTYVHQRRTGAFTATRLEDFNRGRPVHEHWRRVDPATFASSSIVAPPAPARIENRRFSGNARPVQPLAQAPMFSAPTVTARPRPQQPQPQPQLRSAPQPQLAAPADRAPTERSRPAVRPQADSREQQQAHIQAQREQALRQQQAAVERQQAAVERQQAAAERQQAAIERQQAAQARQQQAQERAQRQHQAAQERAERQPQLQQQQQHQLQQPQQPPKVAPPQRGEARERAAERKQEAREDRRSDDDGAPGRAQGHGRGGRFN